MGKALRPMAAVLALGLGHARDGQAKRGGAMGMNPLRHRCITTLPTFILELQIYYGRLRLLPMSKNGI
jgi:hypothetical protein